MSFLCSIDWDIILKAIPAFTGIATLYFAYRVFKSFDIKKNVLKKQLDTVFELVESLQKISWTIVHEIVKEEQGADLPTTKYDILFFSDIDTYILRESSKEILDNQSPIFYESNYELDFLKFATNPFLPKQIASAIKNLSELKYGFTNKRKDRRNYVVIGQFEISKEPNVGDSDFTAMHQIINPEYKTFGNYLNELIEIRRLIKVWLKKFKVKDMNI